MECLLFHDFTILVILVLSDGLCAKCLEIIGYFLAVLILVKLLSKLIIDVDNVRVLTNRLFSFLILVSLLLVVTRLVHLLVFLVLLTFVFLFHVVDLIYFD